MSQDAPARQTAYELWSGLQAEYERYRESISYIPTSKLRLQEDLRRYLCLRCAGFLEQVTFVILTGYLEQKSNGPHLAFAKSFFKRAPNLKVNVFIELVGRFGDAHRADFEAFLTKRRREALSNLLDVRNDIAHGQYSAGQKLEPTQYLTLCEEVYDWLVDRFIGDSVAVLDDSGLQVTAYERIPS